MYLKQWWIRLSVNYSFVKVCSGVLKGDDVLYNTTSETEENLEKIYTMCGNKPVEVSEMFAGDIGAIAKLSSTKTGDTLSAKSSQIVYGKTDIPNHIHI